MNSIFKNLKPYLFQAPKFILLILKVLLILPYLKQNSPDSFNLYSNLVFLFMLIRPIFFVPMTLIGNEIIFSNLEVLNKHHFSIIFFSFSVGLILSLIKISMFYLIVPLLLFEFFFIYISRFKFKILEINPKKWTYQFAFLNIEVIIDFIGIIIFILTENIFYYITVFTFFRLPFIIYHSRQVFSMINFDDKNKLKSFKPKGFIDNVIFSFSSRLMLEGAIVITPIFIFVQNINELILLKFYFGMISTIALTLLNPISYILADKLIKRSQNILKSSSLNLSFILFFIASIIIFSLDQIILLLSLTSIVMSLNMFFVNTQKRLIIDHLNGFENLLIAILSVICLIILSYLKLDFYYWFGFLLFSNLIHLYFNSRKVLSYYVS
jgi:hypothetical protein